MEKDFNIQEGITKAHPEFKQKVIKPTRSGSSVRL